MTNNLVPRLFSPLLALLRRLRRHAARKAGLFVALAFAAGGAALLVTLGSWGLSFSVATETEIVELSLDDSHRSPWTFKKAALHVGSAEPIDFSGQISVGPRAKVRLERRSSGPLRLRCLGTAQNGPLALFEAARSGETRTVNERFVLSVDDFAERANRGETIVLPFTGSIVVGSELGADSWLEPAVLRRGEIALLAHSLFRRTAIVVESASLQPADYLRIPERCTAAGVVLVNEVPGMTASFRFIGDHVWVRRYGSSGYMVRASILARILRDTTVQALWTVAGAFWGAWLLLRGSDQ